MKKKCIIFVITILIFTTWYFLLYKPEIEEQKPILINLTSADKHILWGKPRGYDLKVFEYEGFVSGYDTVKLNPRWVSYNVKSEYIHGIKYLKYRKFRPDPRLELHQTATNSDYTGSGFDRGHLARQSNMKGRSPECELEACYFTNVSPQKQNFNRIVWSKIEQTAINLTERYDESWIVTGPYFDDDILLLNNRIEIPDGFYKILILKKNKEYIPLAFVLDMNSESLNPEDHLVSIDSVESLTGLDFFHELEDSVEAILESKHLPLPYGWK
ncbi:MAG: DNA/RNA non-specific endonuclease [Candidatus Delongbacteria bacterium]